MTCKQQTKKLLGPLAIYAEITKAIAVTLNYPTYAMDGTIGPKLLEDEKAGIKGQIAIYVTNNWMLLIDSDVNFKEIVEIMWQHLCATSSEIGDIIFFLRQWLRP
jgi:hypothetical protein